MMILFLAQDELALSFETDIVIVHTTVQAQQDLLTKPFQDDLRSDQAFGEIITCLGGEQALAEALQCLRYGVGMFGAKPIYCHSEQRGMFGLLSGLGLQKATRLFIIGCIGLIQGTPVCKLFTVFQGNKQAGHLATVFDGHAAGGGGNQ